MWAFPKGNPTYSHRLRCGWRAVWLDLSTSETSRMGMRNATYLLTQYTLLEWFSGFKHSILKVFLDKYRRYVTNWIQTPLFIDRLPSHAFYFYNFLITLQKEYRTENYKNLLLINRTSACKKEFNSEKRLETYM